MYYSNIGNEELQKFHGLTVPNFSIKLSDVLTSDLFIKEQVTDDIYKIYPLFYTESINSTNNNDKILENKCLICTVQEKETYLTFTSNENEETKDYSDYASYYGLNDNLSVAEFNGIISLLRHNTRHTDTFKINDKITGKYGTYEFNLNNALIQDNGIKITNELLSEQLKVRLTDNYFHYSRYILTLTIIYYSEADAFNDDIDYVVVDTLQVELQPEEWVVVPLNQSHRKHIILFDATVEIVHDKPVIPDVVQSISVDAVPDIIQTGENAEIYATGLNNGRLPVGAGHTIHFFEKLEPSITVSATPSIIQTSENTEIYAKVKDEDGSLAQNVKVHFYEEED